MLKDYTRFCVIVGVHGVRGELKAFPKTDDPDFYRTLRHVFLLTDSGAPEKFEAETIRYRPDKDVFLIKLRTVNDREHAESFRRKDVFVADSDLPPLEDGTFFIHDLVGCDLVSVTGEAYGKITGYFENMSHGTLEVDGPDGPLLIPMTDEIITDYRLDENIIVFKPIEGLVSLNRKRSKPRKKTKALKNDDGSDH